MTALSPVDEPKNIYITPDSNIFKNYKEIPEEITVLATFGNTTTSKAMFGFYIGDLKIAVVDGMIYGKKIVDEHGNYSIRILMRYDGMVTVQNDEGENLNEPSRVPGVFDGLNIADIGLRLFHADAYPVTVALKGLAIYSNVGSEKPSYWNELQEEEKKEEEK